MQTFRLVRLVRHTLLRLMVFCTSMTGRGSPPTVLACHLSALRGRWERKAFKDLRAMPVLKAIPGPPVQKVIPELPVQEVIPGLLGRRATPEQRVRPEKLDSSDQLAIPDLGDRPERPEQSARLGQMVRVTPGAASLPISPVMRLMTWFLLVVLRMCAFLQRHSRPAVTQPTGTLLQQKAIPGLQEPAALKAIQGKLELPAQQGQRVIPGPQDRPEQPGLRAQRVIRAALA